MNIIAHLGVTIFFNENIINAKNTPSSHGTKINYIFEKQFSIFWNKKYKKTCLTTKKYFLFFVFKNKKHDILKEHLLVIFILFLLIFWILF